MLRLLVSVLAGVAIVVTAPVRAQDAPAIGAAAAPAPLTASTSATASPLEAAERLFYSGRYEDAAAMASALRSAGVDSLPASELRSSALHFQLKRLIGEATDKGRAFERCAPCPDLLAAFNDETRTGIQLAKARLETSPDDLHALFLLGKLDLNHVWLNVGTLGKKTGWGEYKEARRSLDTVLTAHPNHVRARVSRAWIDYIVDTRVPWAFRWILGGGNKKKALAMMREAAAAEAPPFVRAEAQFALWEMLVREKQIAEAVTVAERLAREFPDNAELVRFLKTHRETTGKADAAR
jgi:hypothetical protein